MSQSVYHLRTACVYGSDNSTRVRVIISTLSISTRFDSFNYVKFIDNTPPTLSPFLVPTDDKTQTSSSTHYYLFFVSPSVERVGVGVRTCKGSRTKVLRSNNFESLRLFKDLKRFEVKEVDTFPLLLFHLYT